MHSQSPAEILENLPYDSYYEAFYKLRDTLPPPLEETAEAYARRDRAVLNQIKQLVPASAIEAELAAKSVAAGEFEFGCLREARRLAQRNPSRHHELIAQAARMGRESRGYLASLQRVQALRVKREATETGAYRADVLEEYAGNLMLRALADPPRRASPAAAEATPQPNRAELLLEASPADAPRDAAAEPPDEPEPRPEPETAVAAGPARRNAAPTLPPPPVRHFPAPAANRRRPQDDDKDDEDREAPGWPALAERYAIHYPQRARLIRRLGGLPEQCDFGPPEPELVMAVVRGTTPELLALDG